MMPGSVCAVLHTSISVVVPIVCAFLPSHIQSITILQFALMIIFALEKYRAGALPSTLFFVILSPLVSKRPLSCLRSLFSKISWPHDRNICFWFHIRVARRRRRRRRATNKYTIRALIKELAFVSILKVGARTSNDLDERSAFPLSICPDVPCRPSLNARRLQRLSCTSMPLRTATDPVALHGPTDFARARQRCHCGAGPGFRGLFFYVQDSGCITIAMFAMLEV